MSVRARNRPLVGKYAFLLNDLSSGIRGAKFQKATGAELSIAQGEYSEGGAIAPMKENTRASYSNVTLEHGVWENTELYDWVLESVDMMANMPEGKGVASPDQLRNFALKQLKRDRTTLFTLNLYNCQPARFKPMDADNTSDEVQIEELEFSMEFFHKVTS